MGSLRIAEYNDNFESLKSWVIGHGFSECGIFDFAGGRACHLSFGHVPGRRKRHLALSFSANSPRAAPVPCLIAVSRASGQVVSCARAHARTFSRRGRFQSFKVSLWGVIVSVCVRAVPKNQDALRYGPARAGRAMAPAFDPAKLTSIPFCASPFRALRCHRRSGICPLRRTAPRAGGRVAFMCMTLRPERCVRAVRACSVLHLGGLCLCM